MRFVFLMADSLIAVWIWSNIVVLSDGKLLSEIRICESILMGSLFVVLRELIA